MVEVRWILHGKSGRTVVSGWNADFISFRKSKKELENEGGITSVQLQTQHDNKLYTLSAKDIGKDVANFWEGDNYELNLSTGVTTFISRQILMEIETDKWLLLEVVLSNGEVKSKVVNKHIKTE